MIYLMMLESGEDKDRFVVLYNKYRKLMQTVCYRILRDDHLAEDATHDAFFKLTKYMDKIKDIESHETKRYLITIAKTAAIDIYRKNLSRRLHEVSFDEMDYFDGEVVYMNQEEGSSLVEILKHLPAIYRDVLLLKYSNCYSNKEISNILNISEDSVRQRISRGKKIIENNLGKEVF